MKQTMVESIRKLFGRHVAPEAAAALTSGAGNSRVQSIVAMVTNITDSWRWMDTVDPTTLTRTINQYYSTVSHEVMVHGGMLDKFMGDRTLTLFLSPSPDLRQEISCALDLLSKLQELRLTSPDGTAYGFNVSLVAGEAFLGTWGDEMRMNYTAIGKPASLAFRLCSAAKPDSLIIDAGTFRLIPSHLKTARRARLTQAETGAAYEISLEEE